MCISACNAKCQATEEAEHWQFSGGFCPRPQDTKLLSPRSSATRDVPVLKYKDIKKNLEVIELIKNYQTLKRVFYCHR